MTREEQALQDVRCRMAVVVVFYGVPSQGCRSSPVPATRQRLTSWRLSPCATPFSPIREVLPARETHAEQHVDIRRLL